ncbi:MAG: OmpP1/FadL family transporter [Hyphomicrobiaceae bacterium]
MSIFRRISTAALLSAAAVAFATPASATEGYAAIGFGARHKALAGAGAADSRDATAASLNPAGLTHVGNEIVFSISAFNPERGFSTDSAGPVLPGPISVDSDKPWFFIPNMAISTRAFANPLFDVLAFSMVGNGGMNSNYPGFPNTSPFCGGTPQQGPFCFGRTGVNLLQMVMSVAMAKQIAPGISVGIAPMAALQSFESRGLQLFNGFSVPGGVIENQENDWGYGFGLRGGIEIQPMQNVRIGVTGTTPFAMSKMNHYTGLFAEAGGFDIPASLQVGLAVDVNPALTLMFDWRHIWFSTIDSVGNPSTNILGCFGNPNFCLGGSNGPGFGWKDVDAFKFGIEYRHSDKLTLRGGYAYNTQPVQSRDVTFNIIAPAVTQHHITAGLAYDLGGGYTLELSGMYAPKVSVTGPELFDQIFGAGTQNVTLEMHQYEVTMGIKYKFGEPEAPLK